MRAQPEYLFFGDHVRPLRESLGPLRDCGEEWEIDPARLSKIESGKAPPPLGETLDRMARGLGLRGADRRELRLRAHVARGLVPPELLGSPERVMAAFAELAGHND